MLKSELIKKLQESLDTYGDGPVYMDLDVGDDICEVQHLYDYSYTPDLPLPVEAAILTIG